MVLVASPSAQRASKLTNSVPFHRKPTTSPLRSALLALSILSTEHLLSVQCTSTIPPPPFASPPSTPLSHVNMLIGNGGDTPNGSGGTIPSVAPPFGMTRWVAQTQVSYVSATPFNWTGERVMGVMGTRQPAIWMGESGSVGVSANVLDQAGGGEIVTDFEQRGLRVKLREDGTKEEVVSAGYYSVLLDDAHGGTIQVEQTATSRVAHLRFTFSPASDKTTPYLLFDVARPSIITSTPTNVTYPVGGAAVHERHTLSSSQPDYSLENIELCGYNTERQDWIITPTSSQPFAEHFKGYFCARFEASLSSPSSSPPSSASSTKTPITVGFIQNTTHTAAASLKSGEQLTGSPLYAYVQLAAATRTVTVRVGMSFISEDQARANIDAEVPDVVAPLPPLPPGGPTADAGAGGGEAAAPPVGTFEHTAFTTRKAWADLLGRVSVDVYEDPTTELQPRDIVDLEVFWTGIVHTVQFPSEQSEQGKYYSAYDNTVHRGESYTGYSIWDTFRAEWAWQILLVPERIPGLVQSMLNDYQEGGWLPMWKNIAETNIMVGTHADSLVAEAVLKGITGFDTALAWAAVWKDATVPPVRDAETVYADREENVDYEVRAGLSSVYDRTDGGWVADDVHSESASRTLDYAYDDFAAYTLAVSLGKPANVTQFLRERAMRAPFTIFNKDTGFMEARNADGSWAGPDNGWTEGDKWAYSFDVVHDMPGLIEARGGAIQFVKSLDEHFDGGHNDHTNEPSHHIPYLYAMAGASYKTQEKVREIAIANYNNTPTGLSGGRLPPVTYVTHAHIHLLQHIHVSSGRD
ncbi:hypothetical protein D9619_012815 [Psilocybe cf. subviscida]|uniref:Glycoside hydrolase family 92 protein n=1 Tax=Psilocybe cf. subviscida TaxID=2480587 RepID=A0A8H5ER37_9AGAR|nr:hypothetical protein D9619_012815 [Psilocybe cf. subviscida]